MGKKMVTSDDDQHIKHKLALIKDFMVDKGKLVVISSSVVRKETDTKLGCVLGFKSETN